VARHGGRTGPMIASELAADALNELWEAVSALAAAAPPALLTASAWAVETASGLEPAPRWPVRMPADWGLWCLQEASIRRHSYPSARADVVVSPPTDPILPSWRMYDRALSRRLAASEDPYLSLELLDELVLLVDRAAPDDGRPEARSAAVNHMRALIPRVVALGPSGAVTARTYLWKWPFVTTAGPEPLAGSWVEPVARELRHEYLAADTENRPE
jgi:hypothetical protein